MGILFNNILVFFLYIFLLLSAITMVLCINPIHSVLCFMLVFFCASMIFTLLHIDFIGVMFLMVYVGAIAVLFVFIVMMLNIKRLERDNTTYLLIGGFICLLFSIQLMYLVMTSVPDNAASDVIVCEAAVVDHVTNNDELLTFYFVQLLGILLFSQYALVVVFSGITLLVALIGSIYLTNTTTGYSLRRQDNQLLRNNKIFNVHIF